MCVVWGPSPAVGLSWRGGGGAGLCASGITGRRPGVQRRGLTRAGGKAGAAFLRGDQTPSKAGAEDIAGAKC